MSITIEKGIPLPEKYSTHGNTKYPFALMKAGDSFSTGAVASVRNCLQAYKRRSKTNAQFITRKVIGGVRVWRVQ